MRDGKVVKVDYIEGRFDGIFMQLQLQPIVGDFRKIVVFKIINKECETFFNMLFDDMLNNKSTLSGAGTSNHQQSTKRIDNIYTAFPQFPYQMI